MKKFKLLKSTFFSLLSGLIFFTLSCTEAPVYDYVISNARIVDGTGAAPYLGELAIHQDTIVAVGKKIKAQSENTIDAKGRVLSPGFINMLSWSNESLLYDGRSMSGIKQGVTMEVMGEGWSMGPLNDQMRKDQERYQSKVKYPVTWTSLGEYLQQLEEKGVSTNVASLVGATTLRIHVLGYEDKVAQTKDLKRMQALLKEAMKEGALGLGSSLIYPPAIFANEEEIVALCEIVAAYDGVYMTHMRSEGNELLEAFEETVRIAQKSKVRAGIYHLKAAGPDNWWKMDSLLVRMDQLRTQGMALFANMYTYEAASTGLTACLPPWVQEGGPAKMRQRLQDPKIKTRVIKAIKEDSSGWENMYRLSGKAENIVPVGFEKEKLQKYSGKNLLEISQDLKMSPEESIIHLILEDRSRVGTIYFLMSKENMEKQIRKPYLSFGSDAASIPTDSVWTKNKTHPRAYGNVSRVFSEYVQTGILPLEEAIHRLTGLSADQLNIQKRGLLKEGYYADLLLFDPEKVKSPSTYAEPHQYSEGIDFVWVNGQMVLKEGEHTGALPGRFIKNAAATALKP